MFDEKLLNEYKNVAAPPLLRERIMSYAKHHKKSNSGMRRGLAAAAACFVIVFAIYMVSDLGYTSGISVSINGEKLTSERMILERETTLMMSRTVDAYTVRMTFDLEKDSKISVSAGDIAVADPESGEMLTEAVLKASGEADIFWNIYPDGQNAEYEMLVENNEEQCIIVLVYDTATNTYTICCE